MVLRFTPLHPHFVAESGPIVLRDVDDTAAFVYAHEWRAGDLVIYDNRATMHRARPFDDGAHRRELRRVTTLDVDG